MALVTQLTRTIPIPHEEGEWMTFAMPSWQTIEAARSAHMLGAFRRIHDLREAAGADLYDQIANTRRDTESAQSQALTTPADPWQEYDKAHILAAGITAWSYDAPVTPENIALLDPETAQWAGLTLLGLSRSGFSAPPVTPNADGEYVDTTAKVADEANLAPLSS